MKYNERYDLYLDDDFVIYYWDKKLDKLMQKPISKNGSGYLMVSTKVGPKCVHRVIYETFVGPIPNGFEIDHEDTHKDNNRLDNLKLVTHKENMNNPITLEANRGRTYTEFGRKFREHYGTTRYQNFKLYDKECHWYCNHNNKCRWEV
jgi:hypothetical protein